jgi:hypothetical protein
MLKILYQENPLLFDEVISNLASDSALLQIGPTFEQQTKSKKSIPDLVINQQGFSIYFETKITDWFYSDQIRRHIDGISESGDAEKIIFLLGNIDTGYVEQRLIDTIKYGREKCVIVQAVSFENFISAFEGVVMSDGLKMIFLEFQDYLDRSNLFPKWKYLLDVVNCASFLSEVAEDNAYMCPDTGGAYAHRRAKYFGPYKNKKVAQIRLIKAVISVSINKESSHIKWNNSDENEDELKQAAIAVIDKREWRIKENSKKPYQVFLLSEAHPTNFFKSAKGGLLGSKKYFHEIARDCETAEELALKLRDKSWETFT